LPRQYGLFDVQRVINAAHAAGVQIGRAKATVDESDVPRAEDLLKALDIDHPMNIEWDPTKARSWHRETKG